MAERTGETATAGAPHSATSGGVAAAMAEGTGEMTAKVGETAATAGRSMLALAAVAATTGTTMRTAMLDAVMARRAAMVLPGTPGGPIEIVSAAARTTPPSSVMRSTGAMSTAMVTGMLARAMTVVTVAAETTTRVLGRTTRVAATVIERLPVEKILMKQGVNPVVRVVRSVVGSVVGTAAGTAAGTAVAIAPPVVTCDTGKSGQCPNRPLLGGRARARSHGR